MAEQKTINENTQNVYNPSSPQLEQFNARQLVEIFGASGTNVFSGYFDEDSVQDWNDPRNRASLVNNMRRKSVAVQSGLDLLKAPILTTNWSVSGGKDEQREFIEQQLFGMTQRTWQEFLSESLNYLEFGFSIFEIIFQKTKDGKIGLYDLAPRIQQSIEKFRTEDNNAGVTQLIYGDIQPADYDVSSASMVSIPLQKLLIFTHKKEGDNLMGTSILRPARMHFDMLQVLYRISAISAERFGVGIPIIKFPTGNGADEKAKAEEMGRNLKGNEKGYIALSEDWTIELLMPSGSGKDALMEKLIAHHNRMILVGCMAHSLDLGSQSSGSYALSETQGGERLSFAEQKATYFANQINKYVIKKLVDLNWGEQEEYPVLQFEALGIENSKTLADTYKVLHDMGMITGDPEMVNYIRAIFNLPKLSDEEILDMEQKKLEAEQKRLEIEAGLATDTENIEEDTGKETENNPK